jgi:hypothetical protein
MIPRVMFVVACSAAAMAAACGNDYRGAGALRANRATLQREVEGLRETVTRLERDHAFLPPGDVIIAVEERVVGELLTAQLPLDADIRQFHLRLVHAEVVFRDSQLIRLAGRLYRRDRPDLAADVSALGAIAAVRIDPATSVLEATVALDHIRIDKLAGLEQLLSEEALDELAFRARQEASGRLPVVRIPVRIQPTIDIPAVAVGPIRLEAASLPLRVSVSSVTAGQGRLWASVHIDAGHFTATGAR